MSNKLAKPKKKNHIIARWEENWENILNDMPNGKPRYLLLLAIAVAAFGVAYYKIETKYNLKPIWIMEIVYGWLSLWAFSLFLHVMTCRKDKKHEKGFTIFATGVCIFFSSIPIIIATIVDCLSDGLVKLKLRSILKHFPALLFGFTASFFFCIYPLINILMKLAEKNAIKSSEEQLIRIFIFCSLAISFIIIRLSLKIGVMFNDNVYTKCSGKSQKQHYLETVYDEGLFLYTLFVLAANVSLKIFGWPVIDSVYTDSFFISTTIITLTMTCISKWKNIHEEKHYPNAA